MKTHAASAGVIAMLFGLVGGTGLAQVTIYEPFDYTAGTIDGSFVLTSATGNPTAWPIESAGRSA